ncbi:unnamed protein product [Closterium sp. NIES-53]
MLLGTRLGSYSVYRIDSWLNGTFVNRLGRDAVRRCVGHECERGGAAPGARRREGEGARVTGARGRDGPAPAPAPAAATATATASRAVGERMARSAGTGAEGLDGLREQGGGKAEGRTRGDAQQGCTEGRERSDGGRGEGVVAQGLAAGACEDEASARGGRGQLDRGATAGRPRGTRDHGHGHGQGRRVIVISGPTAVGKSRLALAVAEAVRGGEVVSADSVQVYRGLDVGSAKASPDEQRRVPHHLLDIREPWQEFTAGDFYEAARVAMEAVVQGGGVPVVVGGTGLYLAWLLHGRPATPPSCPALERAVVAEIEAAVMRARHARRASGARGDERGDERSVGAVGGAEEAVGGGEGGAAEGRASAADAVRGGLEKELSADGRIKEGNDGVGVGVGGGGMVAGGMEEEMGGQGEAGREREARERGWASRQPRVRYSEEGDWEAALAALAAAGDPITAGQLARNDWYRLTRAFEILRATGRPRSEITVPSHEAKHSSPPAAATAWSPPPFAFHCFFLDAPRLPLYRRIDRRCEEMVQGGLLEESVALLRAGLQPDSSSPTRAIGYRQAMAFLLHCQRLMGQVRTSEERGQQEQQVEVQRAQEEAVQEAQQSALQSALQEALVAFILEFQQASRRYAKRQITWFRSQPLFQWLPAHTPLDELVGMVLRDYDTSTGGEGQAGGEEQGGGEGRFGAEGEGGQGGVGGGGSGGAWEKAVRREQRRESKEEERALKGYRPQLEIYCDQQAIDATLAWIRANVMPHQQGSQSEQGNAAAAGVPLAEE